METVSRSGLLLWDRTALKSVRSGPVPVPRSGPASLIRKAHPPEQKQPPNSIANAYPTQKETQLNARRHRQRITSRTVKRRETSLAIRSQTRNWRDKKEEQHTRKRKTSSIPSRALIWYSRCSSWSSITSTMVLGLCFNPILLE